MSRPRSGNFTAASPAAASNRFELLERIGVGGIAEIHRARLLGMNGFSKIVALKVLKPELAGERFHRERFGMEARIGLHVHLQEALVGGALDLDQVRHRRNLGDTPEAPANALPARERTDHRPAPMLAGAGTPGMADPARPKRRPVADTTTTGRRRVTPARRRMAAEAAICTKSRPLT